MHMPGPRLHLRTLLVVISILALGISTMIHMTRRVRYCRERAQSHALRSELHKLDAQLAHRLVRAMRNGDSLIDAHILAHYGTAEETSLELNSTGSAEQERETSKRVEQDKNGRTQREIKPTTLQEKEQNAMAAHHADLQRQFERAMWRPWLTLPDDRDETDGNSPTRSAR